MLCEDKFIHSVIKVYENNNDSKQTKLKKNTEIVKKNKFTIYFW